MNIEDIRKYCLSLGGTEEDYPFGEDTLVFKVAGKMFALASLDSIPLHINLKCDPETAIELREMYEAVIPGYHMNKNHWNTVSMDGSVPDKLVLELIDHSYELVVSKLPRAIKSEFENLIE